MFPLLVHRLLLHGVSHRITPPRSNRGLAPDVLVQILTTFLHVVNYLAYHILPILLVREILQAYACLWTVMKCIYAHASKSLTAIIKNGFYLNPPPKWTSKQLLSEKEGRKLNPYFQEPWFRPAFHVRVSAGAFPWNEKSLVMHTEMYLRNHGIHLVVARHFTVFTRSRSCACVLHWYGQHTCRKVAHRAAFLHVGTLRMHGNAFMEVVTELHYRRTFCSQKCQRKCTHGEPALHLV